MTLTNKCAVALLSKTVPIKEAALLCPMAQVLPKWECPRMPSMASRKEALTITRWLLVACCNQHK